MILEIEVMQKKYLIHTKALILFVQKNILLILNFEVTIQNKIILELILFLQDVINHRIKAAKMKQKSAIAAWLAVFFPSDKTYSVISTKNAEKKLKLISEIECEVLFGKTWYSGRILGGFTKKCDAQDITQKAEGKEI